MLAAATGLTMILLVDAWARQNALRQIGSATLTERAALLTSLEAAALSVPMWNLDQDQLEAALDALATDPDFATADLLRPDGTALVRRAAPGLQVGNGGPATVQAIGIIRFTDHGETRRLGTLRLALTTTRLNRALRVQLRIQAMSVVLLLVAVMLAVHGAVRQLIRPLDLLTSALGRLAHGDLEAPVPALDRDDEVGDVARALRVFRDTAQRLALAEGQFRVLFDHSALGIFGADAAGRITSVNPTLLAITGRPDLAAAAAALADESLFVVPGRRDELGALIRRDGGYVGQSSEFKRPDGSTRWVSQTLRGTFDDSGRLLGFTGTVEDITDRMRLQREERLRVHAAVQSANDAILIADEDGRTLLANRAFVAAFGGQGADTGPAGGVAALMTDPAAGRALVGALRSGTPWQGEATIGSNGALMLIRVSPILDDQGGRVGALMMCSDLTSQRAAEARIHHMAHHDALTGLPNRVMFGERLNAALHAMRGRPAHAPGIALLCLDLDRFKEVNDTLGHAAGDALLRIVADRLNAATQPGDLVARLGGDEFVVLRTAAAVLPAMPGSADALRAGALALAAQLISTLSEPYRLADRDIAIGLSVGIALAPDHTSNPGQLMRFGDMALYEAKSQGRGRAELFTPALDSALRLRTELERDLRRAVADEAFDLFYQPQYRLADGALLGGEALLRWTDPQRGSISPADFIPIAEASLLIAPLGAWVLRTACREATRWESALSVAVNLSPVQFRTTDLVELVAAVLGESGLAASRLELEITEGILLEDAEQTLATLRGLKALGVRIAMDDFGTGYSSLSYLSRMPIDKLKIDQSFTRALGVDAAALPLVRSIVGIAQDLGIVSLAEGVETEAQAELLRAEGCLEVQGYLFGRPMAAGAFAALGREVLARVA